MSARDPLDFSDLDDTSLVSTGHTYRQLVPDAPGFVPGATSKATVARFTCERCAGKGRVLYGFRNPVYYPCKKCHGKGLLRTDARVRAQAKAAREACALKHAQEWHAAHRPIVQWLESKSSGFAHSLLAALAKYGELTDNQVCAVERCIAQDAARAAAPRVADAQLNPDGFTKLRAVFDNALRSKLKFPKLRIGKLVISVAPATGKNAGCLYVKSDDIYLGKITKDAAFFASADCTLALKACLVEIAADPLRAATLHGLQTGVCSCCGAELTNAESIKLGIGPICRAKWGL